jgi:hypothetical protein
MIRYCRSKDFADQISSIGIDSDHFLSSTVKSNCNKCYERFFVSLLLGEGVFKTLFCGDFTHVLNSFNSPNWILVFTVYLANISRYLCIRYLKYHISAECDWNHCCVSVEADGNLSIGLDLDYWYRMESICYGMSHSVKEVCESI